MMSTRTILTAVAGLAVVASTASAQSSTPPTPDPHDMTINQRLENQHDRLHAGTQDDQLTKGERTHLRADDAAIRAQERVYRQANGGKLTAGEKRQLTRELNQTSRQIYRDRHNNRKPKA